MRDKGSLVCYKLLRQRKDGTLGPLFINRHQRIPIGHWLEAERHPTPGYAVRPGWHCVGAPLAPHLSLRGRVWCHVEIQHFVSDPRPFRQGGLCFLAQRMMVLGVLARGVHVYSDMDSKKTPTTQEAKAMDVTKKVEAGLYTHDAPYPQGVGRNTENK